MKYVIRSPYPQGRNKRQEQMMSVYEDMTNDHGLSANLDDLHKKA